MIGLISREYCIIVILPWKLHDVTNLFKDINVILAVEKSLFISYYRETFIESNIYYENGGEANNF